MDFEVFKCSHCGQMIVKVKDTGVPVICCGEPMNKLTANTSDAAREKHVPQVTVEDKLVKVNVGSVDHPMVDVHYIEWVVLTTNKNVYAHKFIPGDKPYCEFTIGDEEVTNCYAYCNIHSLWAIK